MPLTAEEMVAAEAARRMLADPHFNGILDNIVQDAASKAVFSDDLNTREANRQLVLAISRIRGDLQANADAPEADKASEELARTME